MRTHHEFRPSGDALEDRVALSTANPSTSAAERAAIRAQAVEARTFEKKSASAEHRAELAQQRAGQKSLSALVHAAKAGATSHRVTSLKTSKDPSSSPATLANGVVGSSQNFSLLSGTINSSSGTVSGLIPVQSLGLGISGTSTTGLSGTLGGSTGALGGLAIPNVGGSLGGTSNGQTLNNLNNLGFANPSNSVFNSSGGSSQLGSLNAGGLGSTNPTQFNALATPFGFGATTGASTAGSGYTLSVSPTAMTNGDGATSGLSLGSGIGGSTAPNAIDNGYDTLANTYGVNYGVTSTLPAGYEPTAGATTGMTSSTF